MLTLQGAATRRGYCDGLSRRSLLKVGGLVMGELSLPGLLEAEAAAAAAAKTDRIPKINKQAGRDHWARVNSALLSGGGMKVGQVIGANDKL